MSDKEIKNNEQEQDALQIINDPKYNLKLNPPSVDENEAKSGVSRRDMLKYSGMAAAALSVAGSATTGFKLARTGDAYTGWGNTALGKDQFFNREPFRAEMPAMFEQEEPFERRVDWHESYLRRWKATNKLLAKKIWNPKMGVDKMPGYLGDYYRSHPEKYAHYLQTLEIGAKRSAYMKANYDQYALQEAYLNTYLGNMTTWQGNPLPEDPRDKLAATGIEQPPEVWDFRHVKKDRKRMEFKTPKHASDFIKTIANKFGMSFVGVHKFDERFMFTNVMGGMHDQGVNWGDKVPEHWKSVIVYGIPMEWDRTQAASGFMTAQDAYFKCRIAGALLERFLQELGYAGRAEVPIGTYEIMTTPYILLTGLGEYARAGFGMIPEVGANFRSSAVITDLIFEDDKPINIGMAKFCKKCKICADTCPTGAIETGDEPKGLVRGVRRWLLDEDKCHHGWLSTVSANCGTCMGVCPFTRKNTWIHAISRELDARDSFGIVGEGLLAMQLNFFKYPTAEEFLGEYMGGEDAVYHNPPIWNRTEEWFSNIVKTWDYAGMD